jgi:polyphosphate glucokinase
MGKKIILGIDVGATGIKGGLVDIHKGQLVSERIKMGTPKPAEPESVAEVIKELIENFDWDGGTIGCGFPSIIKNGVCHSAANIASSWIGLDAAEYLKKKTGYSFAIVNDADAAGLAELLYGKAKSMQGTVMLLTLGTGIGSAIFIDGKLVPNTELGHLFYKKSVAENYVSNRARKERELSYKDWGKELNLYLEHLNKIFSPELIILGGGVSKRFELYSKYFTVDTKVVSANLYNDAGIIGAAIHAMQDAEKKSLKKKAVLS